MWGCRLVMLAGMLSVLPAEWCAAEPGETCTRLKESIPAADIGLPTGGATIESAELKQPTPLTWPSCRSSRSLLFSPSSQPRRNIAKWSVLPRRSTRRPRRSASR
jgi:hypothetical protein